MKKSALIVTAAIVLATTAAAFAYSSYGATYPTASTYSYGAYGNTYGSNVYGAGAYSYNKYATAYGYGGGYTMFNGRVYNGYAAVDGYRLTQYGPYPYPPSSHVVSDPQFRGHYDAWSGNYYYAQTGALANQYPRSSGGVPAVHYPREPYTIQSHIYY